jgi:ParB-like chromosome segregation protein Spo0J
MTASAPVSTRLGFERETRIISLDAIAPLKPLSTTMKQSQKYRQIAASIKAIGLVELPVVVPDISRKGMYFLLDGLLRIEALREQGAQSVECIVSLDDEAYTYNKRISRLSAIQEHRMVVRAVERGVPAERIAEALSLDIASIRRRFRLLDGICQEVAELMADKPCTMAVLGLLKRMKPLRQMQAAELIVGQNNYTSRFAKAILAGTPQDQLVEAVRSKPISNVSREQIGRLERELESIQKRTRYVEETYGVDNLCLMVAKTYLAKLLTKPRIVRWLERHRSDYLGEFQSVADMRSLSGSEAAGNA